MAGARPANHACSRPAAVSDAQPGWRHLVVGAVVKITNRSSTPASGEGPQSNHHRRRQPTRNEPTSTRQGVRPEETGQNNTTRSHIGSEPTIQPSACPCKS